MSGTIVDEILSGRRFPYSRAFALAGFTAAEAEEWRRAGWDVAADAAPWHRIETAADAADLLGLALRGYEAEDVRQVSRFAPVLTVAWTNALVGRRPPADIDLRDVALQARVRENLLRENHPIEP